MSYRLFDKVFNFLGKSGGSKTSTSSSVSAPMIPNGADGSIRTVWGTSSWSHSHTSSTLMPYIAVNYIIKI